MSVRGPAIVLLGGPTGVGKSDLAVSLARELGGEIVNADSQQVYRGMDVGTGKPEPAARAQVPHHLFDLCNPSEQLDAARFVAEADRAIGEIAGRGRLPLVVGGTGLWLRALRRGLVDAPPRDQALRARLEEEARVHGWPSLHARLAAVDSETAARIAPTDPVRIVRALEVHALTGVTLGELHRRHAGGAPRYRVLALALELPRELLEERIRLRAAAMFATGILEETRRLSAEPGALARVRRVMGYREALLHLEGALSREQAVEQTAIAQRRYAKRQFTWFRGESDWQWLDARAALPEALEAITAFLRLQRAATMPSHGGPGSA